jgi:hypothetical protein
VRRVRAGVLHRELEGAELLVGVVAQEVRERVTGIEGYSAVGAHVEEAVRTGLPFDVTICADEDIFELVCRFLDGQPGHRN